MRETGSFSGNGRGYGGASTGVYRYVQSRTSLQTFWCVSGVPLNEKRPAIADLFPFLPTARWTVWMSLSERHLPLNACAEMVAQKLTLDAAWCYC